ncbi:hypothetical protein AB4Y30_08055 [Ornithinibacillus sp. 4-3]|uniref:Uncharacterized protein n=1 Tax=Ornithinibacillus sp. 4-3 TaxID=3231488 RepID=A0AB39HQQ4_9BACI
MAKYDLTFKLAVIRTYLNGDGYLIIGSCIIIKTACIKEQDIIFTMWNI